MNGMGVEKDIEKSIALFKESAKSGDPDAQSVLGTIFEFGIGVTKDRSTAVMYYKQAATAGNMKAKEAIKRLL